MHHTYGSIPFRPSRRQRHAVVILTVPGPGINHGSPRRMRADEMTKDLNANPELAHKPVFDLWLFDIFINNFFLLTNRNKTSTKMSFAH